MSIIEKKIEVLAKLKFFVDLEILKHYLSLTGWLRNKIFYYVQKTESLQREKIYLLKSFSIVNDQKRKRFIKRTLIDKRPLLLEFFRLLQKFFSLSNFLVHFNRFWWMYVDLDASKERGFSVYIYHVKNNSEDNDFLKINVIFILFLFKTLNGVESRYWLIEFEVVGLIWTIRKIRHFIDNSFHITIIYTNHFAIVSIVKQINLSSLSIDKLNLRLIKASQYLSQFKLNIRHKPDKQHIVLDALFKLMSDLIIEKGMPIFEKGIFDEIYIFNRFLIEITPEYKKDLRSAYLLEPFWIKIIDLLKGDASILDIRFHFDENDFIYYTNFIDRVKFCLPSVYEKKIFQQTHDINVHIEFNRTYNIIIVNYFFRRLTKKFHRYIEYCHEYNLNQTKRYSIYKLFIFIVSLSKPHHIVVTDFVLTLSTNVDNMNTIMIVIYKFFKRCTVFPDKDIYIAKNWAHAFLDIIVD